MKKNIGSIERIIRAVVGIVLISQVFVGPVGPAIWGWIGVVPLVTALMGWCPPYAMLGISTCPAHKD